MKSLIAAALVLTLNATTAWADVPKLRGKPNLNGIWQTMNSANWNLEAHSAQKLRVAVAARRVVRDSRRPKRGRRRTDSVFAGGAEAA